MTWVDYAVLGVFAVSMAVGAWRGLVREVLSILGWVIAFLAANLLAGPLGAALPSSIPSAGARVAVAFVAIFVVALLATSLLGLLLQKALSAAGLGGLDRALGLLFGAARGLLLVLAAALVAGLAGGSKLDAWKDSVSGPLLAQAVGALKPLLPHTLAERLRYD